MDYQKFMERVMEDLKQRMPDAEISIQQVNKLQGLSYEGISIRTDGNAIGQVLNMEPFYLAFKSGNDYASLFRQITQKAEENLNLTPLFKPDSLNDYDRMKRLLTIDVVGKELNSDMLEQIPHKDMADLSVVYRIVVAEKPGIDRASIVVTNEMLDRYGVTPEQLHRDAVENTARSKPVVVRSMQEVLSEMMPADMPMPGPEPAVPFLVATNTDMFYGAGVIAYPDFMEQVSETVKGDFFVLPSSVHEVLILKDDGMKDFQDLEDMVCEVNNSAVSPEEKLSDHAYHYDARDKVFERADKFSERTQVEEKRGSVLGELKRLGEQVDQKKLSDPVRDPRTVPNRTATVSL
ncbi:MAG: DUF5688 family protein [Clostridiales bacterium]|nr:DUF5688 family protein [Clostridiales bacterium]